jgi:hypothetical protein
LLYLSWTCTWEVLLQTISGKLKLTGWRSGKRKKQAEWAGYEVGACFVELDVGEQYQSLTHCPPEHLELAHSLYCKW